MPDSLNILLVCRSFPAHRAGGMEWHAHDLAAGLIAAGHTVHIITTRLPATPVLAPLRINGELVELGGRGDGRYTIDFFRKLPGAVRELARRVRIDLVHAQGFAGIPLALRNAGLPPLFTTIHGTLFNETPLDRRQRARHSLARRAQLAWAYKHRLALYPIWRLFLRARSPIIVDSDFTARELRDAGCRAPIHTVPLGLDLSRYPANANLPIGSVIEPLVPRPSSLVPVFFSVARLEPIKGFATLLEACAALPTDPPWRLVIGGDGPDRERLEALARRLHLASRVQFVGRLADAQLAAAMSTADCFLNPDEGQPAFGLVIAEALLHGTPVLASNVGAHPELIQPGDGALVPPGEPIAWCNALIGHLKAPDTAEARAARRERAVARFSRDRMINGLLAVYSSRQTS